ncbi:hypothetical protein ACHAWF_009728 [Thalassiosira exigua]
MSSSGSIYETLPFIILFFSSMVGHELALESLSTVYQRFPHMATSITLFQFGFCVLLPLMSSVICSKNGDVIKSFPRTRAQLFTYVKLSSVVYGATACATMSLSYEGVTYVTKVVFKSAKLIPTMIVGVIMDARAEKSGQVVKKRTYGLWEYSSAILLCLGASGFCMSPEKLESEEAVNKEKIDEGNVGGGHWVGISLLAVSVFCDALLPNIQQELMQGITTPSLTTKESGDENEDIEMESFIKGKGNTTTKSIETKARNTGGLSSQALMVNTNIVGFTLLLLSTVFRSSLIPIISFTMSHPHFLLLHLAVGVGLGTAVLAYTELIRRSGK